LIFEGLAVRFKGKDDAKPLCSVGDVNGDFSITPEGQPDGFDDIVCHFEDEDGIWSAGSSYATVTGYLNDGTLFSGEDTVCITQ